MSRPNLKEIEWAISELEGKESSETGYALLAALYTCRNEMLGLPVQKPQFSGYSKEAGPPETLARYGDSDFLAAVNGKDPAAAWSIMDELMETLKIINSRVYNGVMEKLRRAK